MRTFYQCNPELFEKCKKTHCQAECTLTTFKEYAKTDEFGNPIIAATDDLFNEEQEQMTEKDKLYAEDLRNRAYSDYERLNHAINELERQTCDVPRNNLTITSQDCINRQEALKYSHIEYDDDGVGRRVIYAEDIEKLPPVTPKAESEE